MEIERFSTGRVRPKRASHGARRYLGGGWSDETLPVNVFLVRHPDGLCLFDTGQTAAAARPGYLPRWHPFLRLARFELGSEDEIGAQLERHGIEPESIRWVVLSHLHTDHVGGVGAFPAAEVIVSAVEWERSRGVAGRLRGYVPQHWPLPEPVLVDLSGPPVGPFPGSFDVAGDGALLVVPTPKHTPGHVSLIVRGTAFLGGDIAHSAAELPPEVAAFCADEGLRVLLAHDGDA
ncbi:MAG TPA: MBL fold metallo-hydrolase [Gaiellaceae bacterium]|nr:MBL fold metallo-hydrolase [Gaiellaceae bacterium]